MPSDCVPAWRGKFRFPSFQCHMSLCSFATCMDVTRDPLTLQAHANSVCNRESPCVSILYWEVDGSIVFKEIVRFSSLLTGHNQQHKGKVKSASLWMLQIHDQETLVCVWGFSETFLYLKEETQQNFSSQLTQSYVFQTLAHVWSVKLFIDLWSLWVSYHFRAVNLMCLLSFVNDLCVVCVCATSVSVSAVSVWSHATGFNPCALIPRLLRAAA